MAGEAQAVKNRNKLKPTTARLPQHPVPEKKFGLSLLGVSATAVSLALIPLSVRPYARQIHERRGESLAYLDVLPGFLAAEIMGRFYQTTEQM